MDCRCIALDLKGSFITLRIMSAQMLAYLRYDMPAARQKGPDAGALMAAAAAASCCPRGVPQPLREANTLLPAAGVWGGFGRGAPWVRRQWQWRRGAAARRAAGGLCEGHCTCCFLPCSHLRPDALWCVVMKVHPSK
jgi:hypothetical protein